jgi:hypothetical protein
MSALQQRQCQTNLKQKFNKKIILIVKVSLNINWLQWTLVQTNFQVSQEAIFILLNWKSFRNFSETCLKVWADIVFKWILSWKRNL